MIYILVLIFAVLMGIGISFSMIYVGRFKEYILRKKKEEQRLLVVGLYIMRMYDPPHPGEIMREFYIESMNLTGTEFSGRKTCH